MTVQPRRLLAAVLLLGFGTASGCGSDSAVGDDPPLHTLKATRECLDGASVETQTLSTGTALDEQIMVVVLQQTSVEVVFARTPEGAEMAATQAGKDGFLPRVATNVAYWAAGRQAKDAAAADVVGDCLR
jgi:hypothetical protein